MAKLGRLTLLQRWEVLSPAHTGTIKTQTGFQQAELDNMSFAMKQLNGSYIMFPSSQKTNWEGFNSAIRDNPEKISLQALGTL